MISKDHRLIYIHPPKTGGSSIETALIGRDLWHVQEPDKWPHNWDAYSNPHTSILKHVTADEAKKMYFDKWRYYHKFATVRHPYKWAASLYLHCKHRIEEFRGPTTFAEFIHEHPGECLAGHGNNWTTKWGIPQTRWLTPFCRGWQSSPKEDRLSRMPMINGEFINDACDEEGLWTEEVFSGQSINDIEILKLENLTEDFNNMMVRLKEASHEDRQHFYDVELPHTNKKPNPVNYDKMLTPELKEAIYNIYKEDFVNFGYEA
tara:strand:- start:9346 stop:10131 length:786 start_codon:yes stop_codon:yes gene_type:complete